ncbi:MAG TPA: hypothetical protein VKS01_09545 [Bryobacteraceae bacterium]|nr:hypothetical protein [Bryobacteraceae bacterium]
MLAHWLSAIWYLNFSATVVLILHLIRTGLYRRYGCLFAFLSADAVQSTLGLLFIAHARVYAWTYVAGQALKAVLEVFVALELIRVALHERPALARFASAKAGYVLAGAALLAAAFVRLDISDPAGRPVILNALNSIERTMDVCLLLLLAVTVWRLFYGFRPGYRATEPSISPVSPFISWYGRPDYC